MSANVTVRIRMEGVEELERDLSPRKLNTALGRIVDDVTDWAMRTRMSVYPPRGDYNRPGPYPKRWYQRLVGPRWALKAGGIGGRDTSEQLQQNWRQQILTPLSREIYTEVSYAPEVVGAEDQTEVHKAHGWQTDEQIAQEVEEDPMLDVIIARQLGRELGVE